jgi:4-hydroxy-2-oxoheptanedioate aldolase
MSQLSLKTRLREGGVALGAWCAIPSALSAEGIARSGYDWVCVDMQHGVADYAVACEMIRAIDGAGVVPVVRVPWNEPGIIGRALDAGALGIIVPMIQSVEDARRVVDACLYPPQGNRSFGPLRAALRDGPQYLANANDRVVVMPMIETAKALSAVEDILAVDGVDCAFVGPMDLSVALGLKPLDNDGVEIFDRTIARVVAAAKSTGKFSAVYSNAKSGALRHRQGFRMISITNDFGALLGAARMDVISFNEAVAAKRA